MRHRSGIEEQATAIAAQLRTGDRFRWAGSEWYVAERVERDADLVRVFVNRPKRRSRGPDMAFDPSKPIEVASRPSHVSGSCAEEADGGGEQRRPGVHGSRGDLFDDDEISAVPSGSWPWGRGRAVMVTVDCADDDEAGRIARALLETRLAAAASHASTTTACRQQGEVHSCEASTLTVKTVAGNVKAIGRAIEDAHSDETPSIWVTPAYVGSGLRSLLSELGLPEDDTVTESAALGVAGSPLAEGSQLDAEEAMEFAVAETRAMRRDRDRERAGTDGGARSCEGR